MMKILIILGLSLNPILAWSVEEAAQVSQSQAAITNLQAVAKRGQGQLAVVMTPQIFAPNA